MNRALPQGSGFPLQSFAEKAKGFSLQSLTHLAIINNLTIKRITSNYVFQIHIFRRL